MIPVAVQRGDSPVILAQPHGGVDMPDDIVARLNPRGQGLVDTDWHIDRLYRGLLPSATVVQAHVHRYVIDANRDPAGAPLYPGQNTTGLVPLTDFDGHEIWAKGQAPTQDDIAARRDAFHRPYHGALKTEIGRVKAQHGVAILFDCHSIRSRIPFLFDGKLPQFNIGTNGGTSCSALVQSAVSDVARAAKGYSAVVNGRFKGGWTTRHHGDPQAGIHAIQLELAQRGYMDETPPWAWQQDQAARLRPHLQLMLENLDMLARSGALTK